MAYRRRLKFKRGEGFPPEWLFLGSGLYGEVFEHRDYLGLVLKVSGRADFGDGRQTIDPGRDAWPTFAQHCHDNPHEHLPQILHFERINTSFTWAIMPKYYPASTRTADLRRGQWASWLEGARGAPAWLWPIVGMSLALGLQTDLHGANVMETINGGLVMTDPFSTEGESSDYGGYSSYSSG